MVTIRIQQLYQPKAGEPIDIKIVLQESEYKQLQGNLSKLCTFSSTTITEPAKVIKTGARHSYAAWLLLSKNLRRRFKTSDYDFDNITSGTLDYQDNLFVIYKVPKKFMGFVDDGR